MSGELQRGAVIHYRNFEFEGGGRRNKYFVILGAHPGRDYLCAMVTSKQWRMKPEIGCHHQPRTYFFIAGDGRNFFIKNTWVQLHKLVTISRVEMIQKGLSNDIETQSNLNPDIIAGIRNCLMESDGASERELSLL